MTRIISGLVGGRRLQTPSGRRTRPTSDRVREALFSRLEHLEVLTGARVLDLYAGSGALGLEALSRGARSVVLVESDRGAAKVARGNAAVVGLPGAVVREDTVERVLVGGPATAAAGGRTAAAPGGRTAAAAGGTTAAAPDGRTAAAPGGPMDLVFLDPPYDLPEDALADVLALLVGHGWLAKDALVVVERSSRSPEPRWSRGLEPAGERRYGETRMWFADAPGPDDEVA